jgi:prophage antirepressor-like protein
VSIILFHFESNEIRFVGTAEKPKWVAADICKVLGISNPSQCLSEFTRSQADITSVDTRSEDGTVQSRDLLTVTEAGMYRLIFKSRKPIAEQFQNWVCEEVLPSIRKTGAYSISNDRENLEKQFRPKASVRDNLDAIKILKAGGHDKNYIQRLTIQMAKAICPGIEPPQPTELISLATTRALLTPTKIAEELGWFCRTGKCSGNAQKVNSLLKELGYQDMVAGRWSATDKAISANLVDRKPVETNSRTQKDQLLWSADIVLILKEHSVPTSI